MRHGPTRRAAATTALALLLLWVVAGPASAGVPPVPGPVQDVVDTVDHVASGDDPVSDAIDAVDDAIGNATGTEDPIQGTIDDVTGTGEEVVDDVGETVDDVTGTAHDVVDKAGDTVDDTIDKVDDATGGTIGDVIGRGDDPPRDDPSTGGRGPRGAALHPDGLATRAGSNGASARAARHGSTGAGSADFAPIADDDLTRDLDDATRHDAGPGLAERLRDAAIEASKKLAIPLALTVVVLGYVIAQYWADRRDPKLAFAPLDSDHDLLSFQ